MGADFSSHRVFVGSGDAGRRRDAVLVALRRFFKQNGFDEVAAETNADRSVVVGPAGRWIFVGDTAGSTPSSDSGAFDSLSLALSSQAPVVATKMSDSAAIHFYLYRYGQLSDKFGNADFPCNRFASEDVAANFRGRPRLWADLLMDKGLLPTLHAAWVQEWEGDAEDILITTATLLGWDPEYLWIGYTHDDEGVPVKYDEFLRRFETNLAGFDEFYFARVGRTALKMRA